MRAVASRALWRKALALALVAAVVAALCVTPVGAAEQFHEEEPTVLELIADGTTTTYKLPDSTVMLTGTNFKSYLFPTKRAAPRAFLVLCYSPWCPHCKSLLPHFLNASAQLDLTDLPHSSFAVVDVQKYREAAEYFQVEQYPTLLYTTGKGNQWHRYEGSHTQQSFMQFSAYLQRALETGSFSEDVSDVAHFAKVEAASGSSRVPCYIYVPASSPSTPENQRTSRWSNAIDTAASVSNIRFAVIYERAQPADWAAQGHEQYNQVVSKARECVAAGKASGPDGEVLLTVSDRYRTPQCFSGPWTEKRAVSRRWANTHEDGEAEPAQAMSTSLEIFLALHGFHAVEDASTAIFDTLAHYPQNYLGVVMTNHSIDDTDTNYVPVLREIVQTTNAAVSEQYGDMTIEEEMAIPRVSWTYNDVVEFEVWRSRYDIELDQLPAVVIIDTKRDRFYKMRTRVPEFEAIKLDTPWKIGGEQHRLIEQFAKDVLADKYKAQKLSVAGAVAEYLSHFRGFSYLYQLVGYEDFVFDIVVMTTCFFLFLLFLAIVVEPLMERRDARAKLKAAKVKTD